MSRKNLATLALIGIILLTISALFWNRVADPTGAVRAYLDESGFLTEGKVDGEKVADAARKLQITDQARVGYDRDQFGAAWADVDGNGCDTRNDILLRDLTDVSMSLDDPTCTVASGTLSDPYTGTTIDFTRGKTTSSAIQIDHVIPLAMAWTGGASDWSAEEREAFANDPNNLVATDGPTNSAKSDQGPGEWMPGNESYHCTYVAHVTALATEYDIAITQADQDAIVEIAGTCAL